jgi:hypothetical protein
VAYRHLHLPKPRVIHKSHSTLKLSDHRLHSLEQVQVLAFTIPLVILIDLHRTAYSPKPLHQQPSMVELFNSLMF